MKGNKVGISPVNFIVVKKIKMVGKTDLSCVINS